MKYYSSAALQGSDETDPFNDIWEEKQRLPLHASRPDPSKVTPAHRRDKRHTVKVVELVQKIKLSVID